MKVNKKSNNTVDRYWISPKGQVIKTAKISQFSLDNHNGVKIYSDRDAFYYGWINLIIYNYSNKSPLIHIIGDDKQVFKRSSLAIKQIQTILKGYKFSSDIEVYISGTNKVRHLPLYIYLKYGFIKFFNSNGILRAIVRLIYKKFIDN